MTNFDIDNHENFCNQIKEKFTNLIKNEPLINDIDPNITIIELKNLLSLEHGESMKLFIKRADNQVISVIVKLNATLKDLKEAIKDFFKLKHKKDPSSLTKAVNWKYVWKNYCISFNKIKILEENNELRSYGICSKTELEFERIFFRKEKKKNQ